MLNEEFPSSVLFTRKTFRLWCHNRKVTIDRLENVSEEKNPFNQFLLSETKLSTIQLFPTCNDSRQLITESKKIDRMKVTKWLESSSH